MPVNIDGHLNGRLSHLFFDSSFPERKASPVEEAKAKIFHWLCSRYHDPGEGNEYIEKDTVKYAIGIPEEVFEKALNEFVDPGAHDCVEVEIPTRRVRLGTGGVRLCEAGTNPFT
jgi:hypothetical protein